MEIISIYYLEKTHALVQTQHTIQLSYWETGYRKYPKNFLCGNSRKYRSERPVYL